MSTGAIIGIIIAVIVVVAVIVVASGMMRRARLRRQFGPEYDRLAQELGSRKKADAELAARQRRVKALNIRELSPEQQASYSGDWTAVQERFVDTPAEAVGAAHTLIWNVMRDRGYPADDRTTSLDALSVHHGRSTAGYRQVMELRTESATTEQLREAMIRYRALFEDLTGLREGPGQPERDRVAAIRERAANDGTVANDGTAPNDSTVADDGTVADEGAAAARQDRMAANNDRIAANNQRMAENSARMADNSELAAENRELNARNSDLAAESTDRAADTPR